MEQQEEEDNDESESEPLRGGGASPVLVQPPQAPTLLSSDDDESDPERGVYSPDSFVADLTDGSSGQNDELRRIATLHSYISPSSSRGTTPESPAAAPDTTSAGVDHLHRPKKQQPPPHLSLPSAGTTESPAAAPVANTGVVHPQHQQKQQQDTIDGGGVATIAIPPEHSFFGQFGGHDSDVSGDGSFVVHDGAQKSNISPPLQQYPSPSPHQHRGAHKHRKDRFPSFDSLGSTGSLAYVSSPRNSHLPAPQPTTPSQNTVKPHLLPYHERRKLLQQRKQGQQQQQQQQQQPARPKQPMAPYMQQPLPGDTGGYHPHHPMNVSIPSGQPMFMPPYPPMGMPPYPMHPPPQMPPGGMQQYPPVPFQPLSSAPRQPPAAFVGQQSHQPLPPRFTNRGGAGGGEGAAHASRASARAFVPRPPPQYRSLSDRSDGGAGKGDNLVPHQQCVSRTRSSSLDSSDGDRALDPGNRPPPPPPGPPPPVLPAHVRRDSAGSVSSLGSLDASIGKDEGRRNEESREHQQGFLSRLNPFSKPEPSVGDFHRKNQEFLAKVGQSNPSPHSLVRKSPSGPFGGPIQPPNLPAGGNRYETNVACIIVPNYHLQTLTCFFLRHIDPLPVHHQQQAMHPIGVCLRLAMITGTTKAQVKGAVAGISKPRRLV